MSALYDTIGRSYREHRRPDPRIAAYIDRALGDAATVVNVGAGTGSYEPQDRTVVAVEPSLTMIRQRRGGAVVQAAAEAIPLPTASFDAAMAIITIHHWADWRAGLAELRRVAERVVVLGFDAALHNAFWLIDEYLPGAPVQATPSLDEVIDALGAVDVIPISVPHDCVDGFFGAYWRRPEAYLDPAVRACISALAGGRDAEHRPGLDRLAADVASGAWRARHRDLLERDTYDVGMRLVVTT
jgi:SAM-dependent methyltransferase